MEKKEFREEFSQFMKQTGKSKRPGFLLLSSPSSWMGNTPGITGRCRTF